MPETPSPHLPTPAEAAALLVEASAIDVDTDRGETIELWTISSDGVAWSASGPRLAVAGGMTVTCRLAQGGRPIQVEAVIEEAEYRSQARASLTLRVVDVATHGYRRRTERLSMSSAASLRAMICDRIVPDEVIPVTLTDLSDAGCAMTLTDNRIREGDRMALTARFLEGEVTADVRIVRIALARPRRLQRRLLLHLRDRRRPGRARAGARPPGRQRPAGRRHGLAARHARRGPGREFAQAQVRAVPMTHIGRLPIVPLHAFLRPDARSEPDGTAEVSRMSQPGRTAPPAHTEPPADRAKRRSRGQAMVEFTLILPLLMLLILGIYQFGQTYADYIQVTNAARDGGRKALVSRSDVTGVADAVTAAKNATWWLDKTQMAVTVTAGPAVGAGLDCDRHRHLPVQHQPARLRGRLRHAQVDDDRPHGVAPPLGGAPP